MLTISIEKQKLSILPQNAKHQSYIDSNIGKKVWTKYIHTIFFI